jgi:ATP-dependent DNA helicase RecG
VKNLATAIQKDETATQVVLKEMLEEGLIESHEINKERFYLFNAKNLQTLGQSTGTIEQAEIELLQRQEAVTRHVLSHGRITRQEAAELCGLSSDQAKRLLNRMTVEGKLTRHRAGRSTFYKIGSSKRARP